ncbi:MAG: hypothetical protein FD147_1112 [Chloroflexi bacterium]|nr:MAG: hypothetical protein FD147_1112 [Chloroflexota bacterium]MBA4375181.1 hypothetical protein [Anaerolinea sp.]
MSSNNSQPVNIDEITPSFSLGGFSLIMLAAFLGAVTAVGVLPNWLPGISQSVMGSDPKAFWYLARGSAFSAYFLLWFSMLLGVGITNKMAAIWPGLPPTIDLHQYTSILGLAFGLFHGLILLGDHFINFSFFQIMVPFSTTNFKPVAVGIGQLGFYLMAIITISFYVRKKIGGKTWRVIHFGSFASYLFALLHGISAGSDTTTIWAQAIYWTTGIILLYMIVYRILFSRANAKEKQNRLQSIPPKLPTL